MVLQGFLNVHISTWARRLITRSAAIAPAAVLQWLWGDRATYKWVHQQPACGPYCSESVGAEACSGSLALKPGSREG